jgi:hypothetical protein
MLDVFTVDSRLTIADQDTGQEEKNARNNFALCG